MIAPTAKLSWLSHYLWGALGISVVVAAIFVVYVWTEKRIDRAHESRQQSYLLADELRQSSDDLTRMVRTYVITGEPIYKQNYQQILDIRDGKIHRPIDYQNVYWDLVLADDQRPRPLGPTVSLLELMQRAGFTKEEFAKLAEAKANSDALTRTEFAAMKLIESGNPPSESNRILAIHMLHDAAYLQAKAAIMRPISEFYRMENRRTLEAVHATEADATRMRVAFILFSLLLAYLLWSTKRNLHAILGGSVNELHTRITRLGSGDFSAPIPVAESLENSVLTWLSATQMKLAKIDAEHKAAHQALQTSQTRLHAIFDASPDALLISDAQGMITMANKQVECLFGYTVDELIGKSVELLVPDRLRTNHAIQRIQFVATPQIRTMGQGREIKARQKNGSEIDMEISLSQIQTDHGISVVSTLRDITEKKRAEDRVQSLAFFDQLTGLPNRTLLLDRLKQSMVASSRSGNYGALLFIDLDNFKMLNDTLGHDKGDMLLKQVAQRLTLCVREGDTVARFGGDEFTVVLTEFSKDKGDAAIYIESVAEKILASLNRPYQLGDVAHRSTASIGATLFKSDLAIIDDLMKQADLAMYKSKAAGRNTLRFFDPDMESTVMERVALEEDLRHAIDKKQFLLHYQVQVAGDGHPTGVEALVRWQHPQRGIMQPAAFIPLAEETGLILPLGLWVLETACTQLAKWATRPEMADLTIAVNVSVHQFRQPDCVDQVLAVINKTGANPQRLKLELTESLLVHNVEEVIEKMFSLKAKGIGFSLDDFGTGYSSLSYLKRLPLDQLKIDQSFVRDILSDPNDAAIAKTIVALAQSLGLAVIAEGVETAIQRDFLTSSGCHNFQGFFFSKPLPVESFEKYAQLR